VWVKVIFRLQALEVSSVSVTIFNLKKMKTKILSLLLSAIMLSNLLLVDVSCSSDDPAPPDCTTLAVSVPPANITAPTTCTTNDGKIIAVASGGVEPYEYKLGSGAYQSSGTFSNLSAGTYLVSAKDSKGCEVVSENVMVPNVSSTLNASASSEKDSECLTGNGTITITASGGVSPYQYKLGTGSFSSSFVFSSLEGGTYSVTVKDSENCSVVVNAEVAKGATGITYDAHIKPILEAKCQFSGCHPNNGDWFTYSVAKANANLIKSKTGSGAMPKGGASAPGGALSADQIKLIACWADGGAPQN